MDNGQIALSCVNCALAVSIVFCMKIGDHGVLVSGLLMCETGETARNEGDDEPYPTPDPTEATWIFDCAFPVLHDSNRNSNAR
jgi:hypothetical protein